MLAITVYATKSYCYAIRDQAPLLLAAIRYAKLDEPILFVFASDRSKEAKKAFEYYKAAFFGVKDLEVCHLELDVKDGNNAEHVKESNLEIAKMQDAAWTRARRAGADHLWSVESDILPQPKTLRCLLDILAFDHGWYDIAMATYPNTAFLGGHGTPVNWILPTVYPDERTLTDEINVRLENQKARQKELSDKKQPPTKEDQDEWASLELAIVACPPRGNVFSLNGERWRQRGWFNDAYPGVGIGAMLPTAWVGLGCTLMNRKALDLANFTGYQGHGTQDLWLTWLVWQANGMKLSVTSHALCSHVKVKFKDVGEGDNKTKVKEHVTLFARHEIGGECHGHLRVDEVPFQLPPE